MDEALSRTNLVELPALSSGKVRDMYDLGDELLIVVTDRISAFDHVLPNPIPHKGAVLNQLSAFWFGKTRHIVRNHLLSTDTDDLPAVLHPNRDMLDGRFTIAAKAEMLPIECVVRGYLSGSGWKSYCETGSVCHIKLPRGLKESERLPEPIFTPSTKAESGHDENVSFNEAAHVIGKDLAAGIREYSLSLYAFAYDFALTKGIIIADTKFEFGLKDGDLLLCDEALTPDSSRFWPAAQYEPGRAQPSFDKQYVRDYLLSIRWNRELPVPTLPAEVVAKTSAKYTEAYERLTGKRLRRGFPG